MHGQLVAYTAVQDVHDYGQWDLYLYICLSVPGLMRTSAVRWTHLPPSSVLSTLGVTLPPLCVYVLYGWPLNRWQTTFYRLVRVCLWSSSLANCSTKNLTSCGFDIRHCRPEFMKHVLPRLRSPATPGVWTPSTDEPHNQTTSINKLY